MNCIIIGDKYQKGMKSKGCPGLLPFDKDINNIQNQYNILRKTFKNINITYICGFEGKKLIDWFNKKYKSHKINWIYNEHYEKYGDCYSLSLASQYLQEPCIIIVGAYQKITQKHLLKLHMAKNSQALIKHKNDYSKPGCSVYNKNITICSFDLDNTLYDVYYIDDKAIKTLDKFTKTGQYRNCFVFELINKLIEYGYCISAAKL